MLYRVMIRNRRIHIRSIFYNIDKFLAIAINIFHSLGNRAFIRNLETKYCALYGKQPLTPIVFAPLRVDGKNKCVTRYKKTLLTAHCGVYRLEAPGDMVALAYHAGLGAKNSIGFGTIRRDIALEQSE